MEELEWEKNWGNIQKKYGNHISESDLGMGTKGSHKKTAKLRENGNFS